MDLYPGPRERAGAPEATLTDRFGPPDTTGGFVTLGDSSAEVIRFSKHVARVKVLVLDNDAVLRFSCRGRGLSRPITIPAGAQHDEGVAAEIVYGANATAGMNARVQVEGYYP